MSEEMYSTSPSLLAAVLIGVPPCLMGVAGGRLDAILPVMGWAGLCIGIFFVSVAVVTSWGNRGLALLCPIIAAVGAVVGFLGWMRAGNTPLLWATGILLCVLVGVALYTATAKTKSLD